MSQIKELKVFVSERLHAAASEILGAIDKTITDYEEQAARLKEENDRHRSLLDIILKSQCSRPEGPRASQSAPATVPGAIEPTLTCKAREPSHHFSDLQCVFTSRTDFLKFAAKDNCPYCFKKIQANETHLMKRHYLFAVHFTEDGTEKFVVPCMCKDRVQGRSHWHCPYCKKILHRKCNFAEHISKQHGYAILQQSQDSEMDHPSVSVFEEEVQLSPEPWCQQELFSLDQNDQQASLRLQIKEEQEQELWRQVSQSELRYMEQLQKKEDGIRKGKDQMGEQSLEAGQAQNFAFTMGSVDRFIQDIVEINSVQRGKEHIPYTSAQPLEAQPDCGGGEICQPAAESRHTVGDDAVDETGSNSSKIEEWKKNHIPCLGLKALNTKRKKHVKKSSSLMSLKMKKSTCLSTHQNVTGSCCKACGKIFHYKYTLWTHVQTHTTDKIRICGICGKYLASAEGLVQHLQCHTRRNKCGICGKQFSSHSRLKRHRRFHRPKSLNVMPVV